MIRFIGTIVAGILGAVIVHVVTILLLPVYAGPPAWVEELAGSGEGMKVMPPALPGQEALPMADPAMAYATCVFDLSGGPVRLTALLPDDFWSLSVLDRDGRILYSLNDRSAGRSPVDLLLVRSIDLPALRSEPPEPIDQAAVIDLPVDRGLVLMRAFVSGPSARPLVEAALAGARCTSLDDAVSGDQEAPSVSEPPPDQAEDGLVEVVPRGRLSPATPR